MLCSEPQSLTRNLKRDLARNLKRSQVRNLKRDLTRNRKRDLVRNRKRSLVRNLADIATAMQNVRVLARTLYDADGAANLHHVVKESINLLNNINQLTNLFNKAMFSQFLYQEIWNFLMLYSIWNFYQCDV